MRNLLDQHLYRIFTSCLLHISGLIFLCSWLNLKTHNFYIILLALSVTIFIRVVDRFKKQPILYVSLCGVIIVIATLMRKSKFSIGKEFSEYYTWLADLRSGIANESLKYTLLTIFLAAILIGIPIYLLQQNFILRAAGALALLCGLITLGVIQYDVSKLFTSCLLTYCLLIVTEFYYRKLYEKRGLPSSNAMTHLIPVFSLVLLVILFFPTSKEPMKWKFVKKVLTNIADSTKGLTARINVWFNPEDAEYLVQFSGYSEDGGIGGDIDISTKKVLTVSFDEIIEGGFYLRGNEKNTYTGSGWEDSKYNFDNKYKINEYKMDTLELYYALARAGILENSDIKNSYIDDQTMTIVFEDTFTNSVFTPFKTRYIDSKGFEYSEKDGNLRFKKLKGDGTEYSVQFTAMNLGSEKFHSFIKNQEKYQYQSREDKIEDIVITNLIRDSFPSVGMLPNDIVTLMSDYQGYVKQTYGALPDSIPLRVKELTEEITGSYDTDYEKCKAIEGYLQNFSYTLSPNRLKEGIDVVDYFLFEKQEGYCTYFATAFAVMARSIGIPTRYVQGFYISSDSLVSQKTYLVTQADAHAWSEAYIQGVGFIPFEATPSYQVSGYLPWKEKVKASNDNKSNLSYEDISPEENYQEIEDIDEFAISDEDSVKGDRSDTYFYGGVIIIGLFCIVIVSIVSYFLIRITKARYRYRKADSNMRIHIVMMQILNMLEYLAYKRRLDETLMEYFLRIDDCKYLQKEKVNVILDTYMRVRYHNEITESKVEQEFVMLKERMLQEIKKEIGFFQYAVLYLKAGLF